MTINRPVWQVVGRWTAGLIAAAGVGACGGGGAVNPFASTSTVDLIFVGAAQTWDLNKDNVVTCAEWKQYTTELFQSADGDRDGSLTTAEYDDVIKQDRLFQSVGFAFFDANGDGKITQAEFVEKPNPAFKILDKNGDCTLDGNELVQTRAPGPKAKETYGDSDLPRK